MPRKCADTPDPQGFRARAFHILAALLEPLPPRPFREWVEAHVVLPEEDQPRPGPFRQLVPAADGVMAAIEDPDIHTVVLLGPVQTLKTTLCTNAILWWMHEDPAPILVFEPDDDLGAHLLQKRLDPVANLMPALGAGFRNQPDRSRIRHFPGASLQVLSGLAENPEVARTARYVIIDEYRKFRRDLYQAIRSRQVQYADRGAKLVAMSSAGDHGTCRTTQLYHQSDMRIWEIPCPECGAMQVPEFEAIQWTGEDPETALLVCMHCHYRMSDDERQDANWNGAWRATRKPDRPGIAGLRINALASPFVSIGYLAGEWIAANRHMQRTGSEAQVRQFVQDHLTRPYRPGAGMRPDLLSRKCRVPYPADAVPQWVCTATLCIDVQDDRLEYEFAGWAPVEVAAEQDAHRVRSEVRTFHLTPLIFDGRFYQYRRGGLEYGVIKGDPGLGQVWQELDHIRRTRRFPVGIETSPIQLGPVLALIDSGGHYGQQVRAYVNRVADEWASGSPQGCQVFGIKGASTAGQPLIRQSPSEETRIDWGGNFLLLGADGAKDWCHAMLRQSRYAPALQKTAVYPTGPEAPRGYSVQYFHGLCAEKKENVTDRYGRVKVLWTKDPATPNEPLDLFGYSLAAIHLYGLGNLIADQRRAASILEGVEAENLLQHAE